MPTATTYKCPNCDGELLFDPATQRFLCEYCKSSFTEQDLGCPHTGGFAEQERQTKETDEFYAHAVEYTCPSCGAQVITDDSTAATFCVYCHNPVVLGGRLSGMYKPDKVLPFLLDRSVVEAQFLSWCKKKKFIKKDFFSRSQQEKLTGIYLPFWIVEATVNGDLHALGRKVRVWRSGDMEYTETETYDLIRRANIDFQELPFAAQTSEGVELTQGVYPFDFKKAVDFSMAYLSGFQAEKRKMEKQDLEAEEKRTLNQYTEQLLKDTATGFSGVTVNQLNTSIMREKWSYMLLPVWMLTYRFQNKHYYFAMNGQTGKVCGKVPLSFARLAVLFGLVAAVTFLILMIGGLLL